MSDPHEIQYLYSFHAKDWNAVPLQMKDMVFGVLYVEDTQAMERIGLASSLKTFPTDPAEPPSAPVKELKDMDVANLPLSQEAGQSINVESF